MVAKNETEAYQNISRQCNYMGTNLAEVGALLANDHPTLQQNFMRIVLAFVQTEAEKTYSDARNDATVAICKEFFKLFPKDGYYVPYV